MCVMTFFLNAIFACTVVGVIVGQLLFPVVYNSCTTSIFFLAHDGKLYGVL